MNLICKVFVVLVESAAVGKMISNKNLCTVLLSSSLHICSNPTYFGFLKPQLTHPLSISFK